MSDTQLPKTDSFFLKEVKTDVYRAHIARPVRTAFGVMKDRPAVIVTVSNYEGSHGLGEVWCNFPHFGAENRARLIETVLAPEIVGKTWDSPAQVYHHLTQLVRILSIQTGEPGPAAQAIAGIDLALWDMVARQAGQPLWKFLGGQARIPVYASGLGPKDPMLQANQSQEAGHRAFKLKVGFDPATDLSNLQLMRKALGSDTPIAVDANQSWAIKEAGIRCRELAEYDPAWIEEPIPADSLQQDWQRLAQECPAPLAGGENLRGEEAFQQAIEWEALRVLQPDPTKWGGITAGLPLGKRIVASGKQYCPHFLGGGVGLLASAHLLAAAGGKGSLEMDVNPNPLRPGLAQPFPPINDGYLTLHDTPGLGVNPDPACRNYLTFSTRLS